MNTRRFRKNQRQETTTNTKSPKSIQHMRKLLSTLSLRFLRKAKNIRDVRLTPPKVSQSDVSREKFPSIVERASYKFDVTSSKHGKAHSIAEGEQQDLEITLRRRHSTGSELPESVIKLWRQTRTTESILDAQPPEVPEKATREFCAKALVYVYLRRRCFGDITPLAKDFLDHYERMALKALNAPAFRDRVLAEETLKAMTDDLYSGRYYNRSATPKEIQLAERLLRREFIDVVVDCRDFGAILTQEMAKRPATALGKLARDI